VVQRYGSHGPNQPLLDVVFFIIPTAPPSTIPLPGGSLAPFSVKIFGPIRSLYLLLNLMLFTDFMIPAMKCVPTRPLLTNRDVASYATVNSTLGPILDPLVP
jgi:hypothetical protein